MALTKPCGGSNKHRGTEADFRALIRPDSVDRRLTLNRDDRHVRPTALPVIRESTNLFDLQNTGRENDLSNTPQSVVTSTIGLESDLDNFGGCGHQFEAKYAPPNLP